MGKWQIAKQFDFCYGHRVWSQKLNAEFSLDNRCVCRHIHGHQGKIIVYLEGYHLKDGMVTDFKHLNWFKKFLDDTLDHKFIIDKNDPMFDVVIPWSKVLGVTDCASKTYPLKSFDEGYQIVDPNFFKTVSDDNIIDILEGFVVVDFVPTSENLSEWLHTIVQKKMDRLDVVVSSVKFFETPKSQSHFIGV